MVTDRVPVFPSPVIAKRGGARIQRDRIEVRKVSALFSIFVVVLEQPDRLLHIPEYFGVSSQTVRHARTGERVDLLVHGNRVIIVAKFRRQ